MLLQPVRLETSIREDTGLYPSQVTDYLTRTLLLFASDPEDKFWDSTSNYTSVTSFLISSSSL
jgi:hypothetical protein